MVQYKRRYGKRRASSIKSISTRRPTASNQRSQLLSLSKKVNTLQRKQGDITEKVFYQFKSDATISSNYAAYPLVRPYSGWTNVFGESDNVLESRKLTIAKVNLDFQISPHTEMSEIDYTIFLVTPKNNKVMRETSGMQNFYQTSNQDYAFNNGITFMNPKRYTIHKVWRCNTRAIRTLIATPNSTSGASLKSVRRYHSMPFRHQLRNSTGTWKEIENDEIPISSALTLIAFNNNASIDLEHPSLKFTAHFTCYA